MTVHATVSPEIGADASFRLTAGFASLRTAVSAVRIWGSALNDQLIDINLIRQPERATLIGLTNLWINGLPMAAPKLDRRRALFVLDKINEILAWERARERERDVRFVELGQYLCEVRSGQYWRLENITSFDEFLEKRFPESTPKGLLLDGHPRESDANPQGS